MPHKLQAIRLSLGLTVAELAELSGISMSVIYRIESGDNEYHVNEATAEALSTALYKEVKSIFDPLELSNKGRPPLTGVSCMKSKPAQTIVCLHCCMEVVHNDTCSQCDKPLPQRRQAG